MRALRRLGKGLLILLLVVLVAVGGLVAYLSITEYTPGEIETLQVMAAARQDIPAPGSKLTLVSYNIGYAGLGRDQNFFMDGGDMVRPDSKEDVEKNLSGILSSLVQQNADIYLLQEVDEDSHRSYYINQVEYLRHGLSMNAAYAYNFKCDFVPFPWPPIGKVQSGLLTLSNLQASEATRESLPIPFSWPVRMANLKRCLLVERIPLEGTEQELVLINLHLEAYDDGEGKKAQTQQLMGILEMEYRNGNYVIAGGDFNQTFPGEQEYPIQDEAFWMPGKLEVADLPTRFSYVVDSTVPSCRSNHANYSGDRNSWQFYMIDGFIVSPNVKVNGIETVDLNFQHSDHQPVRLEVTLMQEKEG